MQTCVLQYLDVLFIFVPIKVNNSDWSLNLWVFEWIMQPPSNVFCYFCVGPWLRKYDKILKNTSPDWVQSRKHIRLVLLSFYNNTWLIDSRCNLYWNFTLWCLAYKYLNFFENHNISQRWTQLHQFNDYWWGCKSFTMVAQPSVESTIYLPVY